ncbi:dinitrogenase iron-molybdenum cofactor biosynthesis protein, partial [Methanosarcinales archaeon]
MKIAISSSGEGLDAEFEPKFGRCKNFVIYDTENKTFKTISNPA